MICDDAEGDIDLFLLAFTGSSMFWKGRLIFFATEFFNPIEDRAKDVGFVV